MESAVYMANHQFLNIKPVERECICSELVATRPSDIEARVAGQHIKQCNDAYRDKFFATWTHTRGTFYEAKPPVVDGSMN
jgi:hypothetical protein